MSHQRVSSPRLQWQALRAVLISTLVLLLVPATGLAQKLVPAIGNESTPVSATAEPSGPGPLAAAVELEPRLSDSTAVLAPLALQSTTPPQYDLPAGVCPVITDYLYQQCQQNPGDAMCAPAITTE